MTGTDRQLRVAFVAGTLNQGGAEKQLVCMARALRGIDAAVEVYALADEGHYVPELNAQGCATVCLGSRSGRLDRLARLVRGVRRFRPHVIQAAHFYANPYAVVAAKACGGLAVGALRSDGVKDLRDIGPLGGWLLRSAPVVIANSWAARNHALTRGMPPGSIHVVPNVLAAPLLSDMPPRRRNAADANQPVRVLAVAGLHPDKRLDRLLSALAHARRRNPRITGAIAGQGPERARLEAFAASLGLIPDGVQFLGHQRDVYRVLEDADMLVLTSEHEGFPNVLLEAMAAAVPVITTPAGDAGLVVEDGVTGYVVGFTDEAALTERILQLAASPERRAQLGEAGWRRARDRYGPGPLAGVLQAVYLAAARQHHIPGLLTALAAREARASLQEERKCPA